MPNRLDGFHWAGYQGLNGDEAWGQGVLFIKDGQIYGGDSMSLFLGTFEEPRAVPAPLSHDHGFPPRLASLS
jgi:hypothetical protein